MVEENKNNSSISKNQKLNWLRAGVLGANDGIISVAALVVGVAGAGSTTGTIAVAATAALIGGAISMALGEYVSVSSQSDSEKAMIAREIKALAEDPEGELLELAHMYEAKGLSKETAAIVAKELSEHNALDAHLSIEMNIDRHDVVSPTHAAIASAISFLTGGVIPVLAILIPPEPYRIAVTFISVLFALGLTGWLGAQVGGASRRKATLRVILGGALALAVTFGLGALLGTTSLI